jgi:hypothetical protein
MISFFLPVLHLVFPIVIYDIHSHIFYIFVFLCLLVLYSQCLCIIFFIVFLFSVLIFSFYSLFRLSSCLPLINFSSFFVSYCLKSTIFTLAPIMFHSIFTSLHIYSFSHFHTFLSGP